MSNCCGAVAKLVQIDAHSHEYFVFRSVSGCNCDGFKGDRFKLIANFYFVSVSVISTYGYSASSVSAF